MTQSTYTLTPIGEIITKEDCYELQLAPLYRPALNALEGFSHLTVLWWFSDFDTPEARSILEVPKPYTNAPETMGIFATRSPVRPNPLALTTVQILSITPETGTITIPYIDANNHTPLLDIKPYTPSMDRVEHPTVPTWCSHWPQNTETSGDFDWSNEFTF